jgi:hypothetical protein
LVYASGSLRYSGSPPTGSCLQKRKKNNIVN